MEWFNELGVFWRTVIVYTGAVALCAIVTIVLLYFILGLFELILPRPKMWIFNKDNTSKRVRNFPDEDKKFYQFLLNMHIGDKALITIKQKDMSALCHLLICRLTFNFPSHVVVNMDDKKLTSQKMKESNKYLITSKSYGEKNWIVEFYDGKKESKKECEYVITCIDPSTAETIRKSVDNNQT